MKFEIRIKIDCYLGKFEKHNTQKERKQGAKWGMTLKGE